MKARAWRENKRDARAGAMHAHVHRMHMHMHRAALNANGSSCRRHRCHLRRQGRGHHPHNDGRVCLERSTRISSMPPAPQGRARAATHARMHNRTTAHMPRTPALHTRENEPLKLSGRISPCRGLCHEQDVAPRPSCCPGRPHLVAPAVCWRLRAARAHRAQNRARAMEAPVPSHRRRAPR